MQSLELVFICVSAFLTVFIVLVVLAVLMQLTTYIFEAKDEDDSVIFAVLASKMNKVFPGTQITKIEELK